MLRQLNQFFQKDLMYQQHLLHFLSQFLLHDQTNLIQILFCFCYEYAALEITHFILLIFFINPIVKRILVAFPFNIQFIAFSNNYFFSYRLYLICFLQFFFVKRSSNFFTLEITNKICPRDSIFNFLNHKHFFRPIQSVTF